MIRNLKYAILYSFLFMVFVPFFTSCGEDDLEDSKFRKMTVERNEFDNWLLANYVQPYNIDFLIKRIINWTISPNYYYHWIAFFC